MVVLSAYVISSIGKLSGYNWLVAAVYGSETSSSKDLGNQTPGRNLLLPILFTIFLDFGLNGS